MSYSAFLVVLAQALLTKTAVGQCINRVNAPGLLAPGFGAALLPTPAYSGYNLGAGIAAAPYVSAIDITPTTGGGLPVTSGSPIPVNSITVASENVYEGILSVGGELPFVGTVSFDGVTPSAGSGAVNHACGNGVTAMASNGIGYNAGSGLATVSPVSIASAPFASITPASALAPSATIPRLASLAPSAAFPQLAPRASSILAPGNTILSSPFNSARALSPAAPLGIRGGLGAIAEYPGYAPYGGTGEGNVAVAGELPVVGNTAVIGQVPIMGAVSFNGAAPAAGAVSIAGKCACEDVLVYV